MPTDPNPNTLTIWTIGHSTRTLEDFLILLQENQIQTLVDVRHFPGSRRFPHFSKSELAHSLPAAGFHYEHLINLGGRRPPQPNSHNLAWRNPSFRAYADYMETPPFQTAITQLQKIAATSRTAIMCSESLWWRCHRSLIADYLKSQGLKILHIIAPHKTQEHPYTSAAQIINGHLSYELPSLFTLNDSLLQEAPPMPPKIQSFKIGDHVEWNSEAGRVRGTIKKKITSEITFKGYTVHASKTAPQYLIKSDKSDHLAMHKPTALKKIPKISKSPSPKTKPKK